MNFTPMTLSVPSISSLSAVWLAAALTTSEQATPPRQPTFTGSTTSVVVDVVVRDRNSRPVGGLAATEFEVYDNGHKQEISAFVAVDRPTTNRSGPTEPSGAQPERRALRQRS